jgi:hypothetical protein
VHLRIGVLWNPVALWKSLQVYLVYFPHPLDGNRAIEWLCLVLWAIGRSRVVNSRSWCGPFSRWWFYVVYVSDQIYGSMWDRVGQLWESGEYWMGRLRVVYFHVWSFKGGTPRLCRLRTDRLAPVNKIDYVLAHMRFMGSRKLSSFNGRWVGWHPTILNGCTLG